jgi:hypothetical protein
MRRLVLATFFFLTACATSSNDPVATFLQHGDVYKISLSGRRENMAHDPVSIFFAGTSPVSTSLTLPRLTGKVDGSEIPVPDGYYRYVGSVRFEGQTMIVDLYYDNTDDKKLDTSGWNGTYLLRHKTSEASAPE